MLPFHLPRLTVGSCPAKLLCQSRHSKFHDHWDTTAVAWMRREASALGADVRSFLPPECCLDPEHAVIAGAVALEEASGDVADRLKEFDLESASLNAQLTAGGPGISRGRLGQWLDVIEHARQDFLDADLIGYLSAEHWLPGYAFPQDVVRLHVRQQKASNLRLERDREYGIAEYAPGSEVVADGKVLRSGAVRLTKSGVLEVRRYRICHQCKRVEVGATVASPVPPLCDPEYRNVRASGRRRRCGAAGGKG